MTDDRSLFELLAYTTSARNYLCGAEDEIMGAIEGVYDEDEAVDNLVDILYTVSDRLEVIANIVNERRI